MTMTVSSVDLPGLVSHLRRRGGDSSDIEVKTARGGCPALGETLCAFANTPGGGLIILGLDENNGFSPVGLTNIAALEQGIAAQAREAVCPPVTCDFTTEEIDGNEVLLIRVNGLPLQHRPALYRGNAYLRQSDGDYRMSDLEIAQIELLKIQQTNPTHPDLAAVPSTSLNSLDASLVEAYVNQVRTRSRRLASLDTDSLLTATGVLTTTGEATLAGLYALGTYPQGLRPSLGVTAAVLMPSGAETRTQDLAHFTGPIPDLLQDVMQWIARNTPTDMGYDAAGHGRDLSALPNRAVRELIANALVHRNLDGVTDSKRVEVRIKADKLIITSPGGLRAITVDQLGTPGGKAAVNPTLYDICKDVRTEDSSRLIEGEGGGIKEIREAAADAGLPEPLFRDSGVSFTAILRWRHAGTTPVPPPRPRKAIAQTHPTSVRPASFPSKNAPELWDQLDAPRTFDELRQRTGLSRAQTRYAITSLLTAGLVEMVGGRGDRQTTYRRTSRTPRYPK
ncbi:MULTISPECIES: ATP-binding protein [Actinomyces]|nr:ATP-binding protein [Actinomyces respiraculi]